MSSTYFGNAEQFIIDTIESETFNMVQLQYGTNKKNNFTEENSSPWQG